MYEHMTPFTRIVYGQTAHDLSEDDIHKTLTSVEQILNGKVQGAQHPVLRMWTGYEHALCLYGMFFGMELTQTRRKADTTFWRIRHILSEIGGSYEAPPWMRDKDFIRSHRSNLAREQPSVYGSTWPGTPPKMPYLWPFVDDEGGYKLMVSKAERAMLVAGERKLPKEIAARVANLS